MLKATVNKKTFEIKATDNAFYVDGEPFGWDKVILSEGYFHIIHKNKSYLAELVKADLALKTVSLKINGKMFSVSLKNQMDLLLESMGITDGAAGKVTHVKAPMPGLIIEIKVKEGDVVKQNDPLLILEAMKMENILKSPGDVTIRSIKVKKGNSVEKGQILIEF